MFNNISRAIKKMSVDEIRDFNFGNYYKRIGSSKDISYYSMKRLLIGNKFTEKIPDPRNAKEPYQSFIRKKNTKPVKQSEIITYQSKKLKHC